MPTTKRAMKKSITAADCVLRPRIPAYMMNCQSSPVITWKMARIELPNVLKLVRGGFSSAKSHGQSGELEALACSAPSGTPQTSSQT